MDPMMEAAREALKKDLSEKDHLALWHPFTQMHEWLREEPLIIERCQGSWLLDLAAESLQEDPSLQKFSGEVADSGEGRWFVKTATDLGVPAHVITAALFERFSSRGEATYANRVLSAMRFAFGGHTEGKDSE